MFYLIECPQNPFIAHKRYQEFLTLLDSGANKTQTDKYIKENKLMPGGLPWRTVLFAIESGRLKENRQGSYFELNHETHADCVKLFAHLDNSEGYYQQAKAKINYTQELPLSLQDPQRIDKLVSRIELITDYRHDMELTTSTWRFPDTKWENVSKDIVEIRSELDKLVQPRFVLDAEICKLVNHDSIREEVYESIHYTRELYDSIVHKLDLVKAWCDTALSGPIGFKKPENYYIVRSDVSFH